MSALISYTFKNADVRVITRDGEPWFYAADVCRVLGIRNATDALESLDSDEKITLGNSDGNPRAGIPHYNNIVSESGLYALIFKSRKPQAKEFSRWVRKEVLPSIRKTGGYQSKPVKLPTYGELARMVLEQEEKLGIAGDIFHAVLPTTEYGSVAPNGQPRVGIRRAAFVAAKNRLNEAAQLLMRSAQMELTLAEGRE